jgi:hypothetical protein
MKGAYLFGVLPAFFLAACGGMAGVGRGRGFVPAAFGMLLRDSPYRGNAGFDLVLALAESSLGQDAFGYRRGFLELARKAQFLDRRAY